MDLNLRGRSLVCQVWIKCSSLDEKLNVDQHIYNRKDLYIPNILSFSKYVISNSWYGWYRFNVLIPTPLMKEKKTNHVLSWVVSLLRMSVIYIIWIESMYYSWVQWCHVNFIIKITFFLLDIAKKREHMFESWYDL